MLKQLNIQTFKNGDRKTIKTKEKFNCLRVTAYSDLAQTPNSDTLYNCRFKVKSKSYTGDLYDLFLLNCTERNHFNMNETNALLFYRSLYSYHVALASADHDPEKYYVLGFETFFTPQDEIEISCFIDNVVRFNYVVIECISTEKDFNLCHSWKHLKNIQSFSTFEHEFESEKNIVVAPAEPLKYDVRLSSKFKILTENGSFDAPMFYDASIQYTTIFGAYNMANPALWLDSHKKISLVNANFDSMQKSLNVFYY